MEYLLVGGTVGLCCVAGGVWRQSILAARQTAALKPLSAMDSKLRFIHDVCDGNLKRADALLTEKMALNTAVTFEQAVDLVYADMLLLTEEERTAIAEHASRRAA